MVDLICAFLGLLVFAPLLIGVCAVLVACGRNSPFFFQTRIGRDGRPFRIWKFRTMRSDDSGPKITAANDPRITRVGRFLRHWKIDELPQLANVLLGQMSMVGPRPEVPNYVQSYTPAQRQILRWRPGVTDMASLIFRDEEAILAQQADPERYYREVCVPEKIRINLEYGERATPLTDLKVMALTVAVVAGWKTFSADALPRRMESQ